MDLYYQRMHGIYAAESHIYKKGVPHDFSKLMKAYLFLSVHPKFDIKITIDGSKPPKIQLQWQVKSLLKVKYVKT